MANAENSNVKIHFLGKGEKAPDGASVYHSYGDPGHSWLKVSFDELAALKVNIDISPFSYQSEDSNGRMWAYLEEDCDAPKFLRAKGGDVYLHSHNSNGYSVVRSYAPYRVTREMIDALPKSDIDARVSLLEQYAVVMDFDHFAKLGELLKADDEENKQWSPFKYVYEEMDSVVFDPTRKVFLSFRYDDSARRWLTLTNTSNGDMTVNRNDATFAFIKWEKSQKAA